MNFLGKQKNLIIIVAVSLLVLILFSIFEYKVNGNLSGAPLDDVYIHFQFSKNLAEGNGFSFNANEPTPGSTSPAWTILMTIPYLIVKNHLLIAKTLSALFFILTGIITYFLGLEILKKKYLALLASVFTLLSGRLAWSAFSGMEVSLFTFLLMLTLLMHFKKKSRILIATLLGLASTVRPEGYLIFIFWLIAKIIRSFSAKGGCASGARSIRSLIISIIFYLVIISPYLIFSYRTTGSFLPNTFSAQSTVESSLLFRGKLLVLYLFRYAYLVLIDNPLITLAVPFGIYYLVKLIIKKESRYLFLILIALGFPLAASILAPNLRHHGRYTIPFIPFYMIIGLKGFLHIRKRTRIRLRLSKFIKKFLLILMLLFQIVFLVNWADTFAWNVKNINDMHVTLGKWVSENTSEDSLLAVNDIGAITYYSQREIIDMIGLVSPEVLEVTRGLSKEEREEPLWEFLKEKNPDFLIILPCWYPNISEKEELREIYKIQLDRYTMVDCEMVVYEVE